MKLPILPLSLALVFVCLIPAFAQQPHSKPRVIRQIAVVVDEAFSVIRMQPSLYAMPVQRMRRGRRVQIFGSVEADGVRFYKVAVSRSRFGWMQSEAVIGSFRPDDEERFVRLIEATGGFDQVELASTFLQIYPKSRFRPAILLFYGDLLENAAARLSRDARSRLKQPHMAASGAPVHSYYLNFSMLDRYRKLGVMFLFNPSTRMFHYNGWSWSEIMKKFPQAAEASEAKKRLDVVKQKMERTINSD